MNHSLLRTPAPDGTLALTPAQAGWQHLGFRSLQLAPGELHRGTTGDAEMALIVLEGRCDLQASSGSWTEVGERTSVFEGLPFTLYLPPGAAYVISARTPLAIAICEAHHPRTVHPARLVRPEEVRVEIRGDANATRQIHHLLPPEFAADRLLVVEVLTPSGNWSSYPPHKHDVHAMPDEADLEEIYYYRIRAAAGVERDRGFAIQRIYSGDGRLDETLTVRDGELVLVPEGYHPVVAPPGYEVYYLNALAGSARTMAATDDPAFAWVRGTWRLHDQLERLFPTSSAVVR